MPTIDEVLEQELNDIQRAAATDPSKEILTLACAGSGKSRTLAYRIARLIANGESPEGIVAFTFTVKAAESIKRRVSTALAKVGISPTTIGAMYIGTIHSYCNYILGEIEARYQQYDVLDENRLKLFLMSRYPQIGLQNIRMARGNPGYFKVIEEVADAWKTLNDEMVLIEDVANYDLVLGTTLETIRTELNNSEFIDYSLMIRLVTDALEARNENALRAISNLQHLLVDEYQDVNPAQERLINEMHRQSETLFVVGDDDQSIYAWRGADVSNILNFEERNPNCSIHTLAQNYRSTQAIVAAADRFVDEGLGASRMPKNPFSLQAEGPRDFRNLYFDTRLNEAAWVVERIQSLLGTAYVESDGTIRGLCPSDFAILMRSTGSKYPSRTGYPRHTAFTQQLIANNIPYTLEAGGSVFDRPQVEALRSTFELLRNDNPNRNRARTHFQTEILPSYPNADFNKFAQVLSNWGRLIHAPVAGARRRVYPQQLVHDLLNSFNIGQTNFDDGVMQDIGQFSQMMLDVETVYISIDSTRRFQDILNFLQQVAENGYQTTTNEIVGRPNAVTVSTVHKVKGLEFPVVFVVDLENERFPSRRRSYSGWLPIEVLQNAMNRGAYQSTREEEIRLFYTAITRAERFLYLTGSRNISGGSKSWQPSPFADALNHPEISDDPNGLPVGLTQSPQKPRVDENILPTSFSEIRYYLRCPHDFNLRRRFGFSPSIPSLFGFGKTIHTTISRLHQIFTDAAPSQIESEIVARDTFHVKHVPPSQDPDNNPGPYERARDAAAEIVNNYVSEYSDDFLKNRQLEARFEIPIEQAVITGAIDLLLEMNEQDNIINATVVDFKTMEGGEIPEENDRLHWTELALQVQLYAKAANDVLGENAKTGNVHFLKDNQRVDVPISDIAVDAAVKNIEWAVDRIISEDFPRRPSVNKCANCDFKLLCSASPEDFMKDVKVPPPIQIPGDNNLQLPMAFSEYDE